MASLAVAAIGAGIGASIGGTFLGVSATAIGWSVGSFLGSQLFGAGGQDVQGPRLSELKVQSSAYGAPLPIIYGKARVSGNVIWAKDIRERKIEEDVGGKGGGGGGTSTTYEYYGSFAVGLCDNEISGVRKIWADSVLIYDVGDTSSLEEIQASNRNADKITIHFGTQTQEADSLIQADKGAANTQAYRGTAYIVFDDLLLEKYGNRIPNITCEVITTGSYAVRKLADIEKPDSFFISNQSTLYIDSGNGSSYTFIGQWTNAYENTRVKGYKIFSNGVIDEFTEFTVGGGVQQAMQGRSDIPACAFPLGGFGNRNKFFFYSFPNDTPSRGAFEFSEVSGTAESLLGNVATICVKNNFIYVLKTGSAGLNRIGKASIASGRAANDVGDYQPLNQIQTDSGELKSSAVTMDVDDDYIYVINSDNTITRFDLNGVFVDNTSFTPSPSIGYAVGTRTPEIVVDDGVIYLVTTQYAYKIDLNGSATYFGTLLPSGITNNFGGTLVKDGLVYLYRTTGTGDYVNGAFLVYQLESFSDNTITLSSIVSDIDERAGLAPLDDNTTALTDTVEGYVVTRPMSARKAIEPLQQAFFFDAAEIDNVLTYVKRGGNVTATIPEVDLGAGDYGQDVDLYVQTRQQDSELPAEMVVDYIDLNRSYEEGAQRAQRINSPQENVVKMQLPIVMTASYAKEIAHVLLYNAHVEREKFSLSLTNEYIDLNPTDVINFTVGSDTRKARITKINYGDTLQLDLLAEDSTIYSAESVAGDSEVNEQVVGLEGPTKLYLMDIPLLRNQDNDAGLYIAGSGYFAGWTGASIFKSLDGGISYTPVNDILAASTMGRATTVLASKNHTTFDYTSTVTVSLTSGTLSSSTESAVIQGANYALLGTEIIQFVNATDNGNGTYTLSTLLRGRRGTDWAVGTHAVGDLFCLLRENVLERVGAIVNTERFYKPVTFGTFLDEAIAQTKTNTGVNQKPFSVKYIAGTRDGSNNLSITWTRRSRYIGTPLWTPPVFEDSESYKVEILTGVGGSVINTYTTSTPAYTYTAAQQTADGLTPGATVYVNIYQVGAVNGYETEATL